MKSSKQFHWLIYKVNQLHNKNNVTLLKLSLKNLSRKLQSNYAFMIICKIIQLIGNLMLINFSNNMLIIFSRLVCSVSNLYFVLFIFSISVLKYWTISSDLLHSVSSLETFSSNSSFRFSIASFTLRSTSDLDIFSSNFVSTIVASENFGLVSFAVLRYL